MMAAINFANACMSASAQPDCAAFACPATTNIAIILDVSLLLASILICLFYLPFGKGKQLHIPDHGASNGFFS